MFHVEQ